MNELVEYQDDLLPQKSAPKRAVQSPLTIIPLVGGVSSFIAGVALDSFLWGILGSMFLSTSVTVFIILSIYFKLNNVVKKSQQGPIVDVTLRKLSKKLKSHGDKEASQQVAQLENCYIHFISRLKERVGKSTAEYSQYLTPAKELFTAACTNLKAIERFHEDISVAQVKQARESIKRLERSGQGNSEEIKLHQRKLTLAKECHSRIDELKCEVSNAITVLIEVATQLNDIVTDRTEVQKSAAVAMAKFNKAADLNRRINEKVKSAWQMMS